MFCIFKIESMVWFFYVYFSYVVGTVLDIHLASSGHKSLVLLNGAMYSVDTFDSSTFCFVCSWVAVEQEYVEQEYK